MSSDVIATERISQPDVTVCAIVFPADLADNFSADCGLYADNKLGACSTTGDGVEWSNQV